MWFRNSEFIDTDLEYSDEEFPEPELYEADSLLTEEALDRLTRAEDMQVELKSYGELFSFTGER
jgi:hypothetical protein